MSNLFSSQELLDMALPMLPKTKQAIEYRAKTGNWAFEYIAGRARGGRLKKYLLSGLPPEIQTAIRRKQADALLAEVPALPDTVAAVPSKKMRQLDLVPVDEALRGLSDKQRTVADARCALVGYVLTLYEARELGLTIKGAAQYVAEQIAQGTLPADKLHYVGIANDRSGAKRRGVSWTTLYRWVRAFREAPTPAERIRRLAPETTKRKTDPLLIGWLPDFLRYYGRPNKPTVKAALKGLLAEYTAAGRKVPGYDTVCDVVKALPPYVRMRGRETGSAYRQRLAYIRRDWLALNPNDVWIGDGHSFKAKVQHPIHGNPKVLEFTAIIDGCSAAIMGWSVSLAENTIAVADAFRHALSRHPLPLIYYSDNGAGQTGKHIDHDITGLLPRLGITHAKGIPGNPQGRARIERFWQSTAIELARSYPTYQGKDADKETLRKVGNALTSAFKAEAAGRELMPQQRQAKALLPKFDRFLADLERMAEAYNERHEHSGLPKKPDGRHYTPMEYYRHRMAQLEAQTTDYPSERLSELELDYLFRPEVIRKVSGRGEIQWLNNVYYHEKLLDAAGQEVRISFDIHNGQTVIVKNMDGLPICKAKADGNKRAAFTQSYIDTAREKRMQRIVKKKQAEAALAMAEARPALEMQPDLGRLLLVGNGAPVDAYDYEAPQPETPQPAPKRYAMLESDLEN